MKSRVLLLAMSVWLAFGANPVAAQEPLVEKVKKSIDKGIKYLQQQQMANGGWAESTTATVYPGGGSCLVMLALIEAGEPLNKKWMQDGLNYVRKIDSKMTYVRALQTMVLAKAGYASDKPKIKENVDWLTNAMVVRNNELIGWSYSMAPAQGADGSNTQFALLGLLAGKEAGIPIKDDVWKTIRKHYMDAQEGDGSWVYVPGSTQTTHKGGEKMTMTVAGVCGLIISGMQIQEGREQLQANGATLNCGSYTENKYLTKGMKWLETPENFTLKLEGRTFYNLYGIERLGRLTGQRFIGQHDWYREGCQFLVDKQESNGCWVLPGFSDRWENISTGFALLFLSKGRTPVLISKVVHGLWPRDPADNDWNRDKYAIKHLTEYIGKELFTKRDEHGNVKPLPLAWQIFDLMKASSGRPDTEKARQEITAEMLQSPILYLNGHNALKLTDREIDLIKRYVENGGFIIAEACCGNPAFDASFRQLIENHWPNNKLTPLSPDHSIWRYPDNVEVGAFNLHGLEVGCKTVLVYSPVGMSCLWEANKTDTAKGIQAFRLGANLVAYATSMVPPLPRLTEIHLAGKDDDKKSPPRFYLKVAQLYHNKNWQPPAPAAMFNLMSHLRKFAGMDVVLNPEKMTIDHEDLANFKFIYFHDRAAFNFDEGRLKGLRFNLDTGGLLFADACCGSKAFDASFRTFVKKLFPDPKHELQRVPPDDPLFGEALNGKGNALTKDNIKARLAAGKPIENIAPFLEGIKIDERWVVLYSKYDIGCALERHTANDCAGYDHDSAVRIAAAAVLYLMSP